MKPLIIIASCLAIFSAAHGRAQAISLPDALLLAYQHNPSVRAAQAGYQATEELKRQAQSRLWQPQISASGEYAFERIDQEISRELTTTTNTNAKTLSLNIDYPLYAGGQNQAAENVADFTIKAAGFTVDQTEQSLFTQIIAIYGQINGARRTLEYLDMEAKYAQALIAENQQLLRKRQATKVDLARARQQLNTIQLLREQQQLQLSTGLKAFALLVGTNRLPAKAWFMLIQTAPNEQEILKQALDNNPNLRRAKAQVEASNYFVKQNQGALLPQFDFNYQASYIDDAYRYASAGNFDELEYETTQSVALSVNIPLYLGGNTYSLVRQAKKKAVQTYYEMLDEQNKTVRNAHAAYIDYKTSQQQLKTVALDVTHAKEITDGLAIQYKNRQVSVKDLIEARNMLLGARIREQKAYLQRLTGEAKLLAVMGVLNHNYPAIAAKKLN